MWRKLVLVFTLIVLILAGFGFHHWFPLLMAFVGNNTDLIQGLANLVQILIWIAAGVVAWIGLLRPNHNQASEIPADKQRINDKLQETYVKNDTMLEGDGAIAQGPDATAVGKGGIHIGGSVSGGNITIGNNNSVNTQKKKQK